MKALLKIIVFLFVFIVGHTSVFADGSKDMYPEGVRGNRAFMVANAPTANNKFHNWAAHYVYAKAGETIAVASSSQGVDEGHIRLISPDGLDTLSTNGLDEDIAKIPNRQAELLGPGVGYTPFEHHVGAGEEGIWKIEFIPSKENLTQSNPPNVQANADWTAQVPLNKLIAAWDVSIRQGVGDWIEGRVYTPVLQLWLTSSTLNNANGSFYGQNYVLTKDGYVYKVDGNGSHGIQFYYFVNSSGILDAQGKPSYKSSNANTGARFHSPNLPDDGLHITHKMMYTMPDRTMPPESLGAVPGGSTWLYNEIQIAEITQLNLKQIEGDRLYVNKKGAYIQLETNYAGRYKIVIESRSPDHPFTKRELYPDVAVGANEILWDGRDGDGNLVDIGEEYPIAISAALMEGEIHFPYFDMEINPQGILISRIDLDAGTETPALVYWDDSDIEPGLVGEQADPIVNLEGIRSDINGHKWGTYNRSTMPEGTPSNYNGNYGAHSFGNERAMDTWSYAANMQTETIEEITVRKTDLEVVGVAVDQDIVDLGDPVTYTVKVRNNGPSDAVGAGFEFDLPDGFTVQSVAISSACNQAKETLPRTVFAGRVRSVLDLPNGCTLTYTITAITGSSVPDATYGVVEAQAGIIRPAGYTDPDATSVDIDRDKPGMATEECEDNCNNIKLNDAIFLLEPYKERGQLALLKEVRFIDSNGSGFPEAGDQLEYTFTVRNVGWVTVEDIYIEDPMLSEESLVPSTTTLEAETGEEITFVYRYTITADDIARKYVENSAWVRGKNPRGFDVKDESGTAFDNDLPTRLGIYLKPSLHITKKVINQGTGENAQFTIGDKIVYQFDIKHTGDIPVEDISIIDHNITENPIGSVPASISNETVNVQAEYYVTMEDIVRGYIENTATLMGTDQLYGNIVQDISGQTFDDDLPTVTPLATPPQGVHDNYDIYQAHTGVFDVLLNDLPGSSNIDPASIEIITLPTLGNVMVRGNEIYYVPTDNYVYGEDSFTYRFMDKSRLYSEDVKVDVLIKRTIPVTADDFYRVGYNYFVNLKPLQNDYVDHSMILTETIQVTAYPEHGRVNYKGDGVFEYRPDLNYTGYDSLRYIVRDKNGNWSEEATIVLEVAGFFMPNVISPNGDNKNDISEIIGTYKFNHIELEIVDRFGRRVYHSTDYKNDWIVPDNLTEGTYFVTFKGVRANEKPVVRKGTVLIQRERYRGY